MYVQATNIKGSIQIISKSEKPIENKRGTFVYFEKNENYKPTPKVNLIDWNYEAITKDQYNTMKSFDKDNWALKFKYVNQQGFNPIEYCCKRHRDIYTNQLSKYEYLKIQLG